MQGKHGRAVWGELLGPWTIGRLEQSEDFKLAVASGSIWQLQHVLTHQLLLDLNDKGSVIRIG